MKFVIFLSLTVAVQRTLADDDGGILFNGIYHDRIVLKANLDRPYSLAVDNAYYIVYFSYSVQRKKDIFKTAAVNFATEEYYEIEGVEDGFAQTVDQENHVPYIGGSKGIYTFDRNTNKVRAFGASKSDIWDIYYRNNVLYYSDFPAQFLYTIINGEITRFKDLDEMEIVHFVVDDDNVMYYSNATGLYSQQKGTKDVHLYKELVNSTEVRGLTIDARGLAYACLDDGIYRINKVTGELKKEIDIYDAFGVAFDAYNDVFYSDATSVVRLRKRFF